MRSNSLTCNVLLYYLASNEKEKRKTSFFHRNDSVDQVLNSGNKCWHSSNIENSSHSNSIVYSPLQIRRSNSHRMRLKRLNSRCARCSCWCLPCRNMFAYSPNIAWIYKCFGNNKLARTLFAVYLWSPEKIIMCKLTSTGAEKRTTHRWLLTGCKFHLRIRRLWAIPLPLNVRARSQKRFTFKRTVLVANAPLEWSSKWIGSSSKRLDELRTRFGLTVRFSWEW